MNENWFWQCPKCGKINCAKEDFESEFSTEFITECENPQCRFKVTAYVEYTQPDFEFYTEDGESVDALDEYDVSAIEVDEENETQTIERCMKFNYGVTDTDSCCLNCKYSRTAKYLPSGEKFVCDALDIQTHENYTCNLFNSRKR